MSTPPPLHTLHCASTHQSRRRPRGKMTLWMVADARGTSLCSQHNTKLSTPWSSPAKAGRPYVGPIFPCPHDRASSCSLSLLLPLLLIVVVVVVIIVQHALWLPFAVVGLQGAGILTRAVT
ncbi:hypothetical protein LX36DRAFT_236369 [Colletotrichum falcatum]|nr:hypothetical protein LX36DRAFT_236369 [Colletotrichum falcatum]